MPYLVEVFVGEGPFVLVEGTLEGTLVQRGGVLGEEKDGIALVPQKFAEIAMRDVVEDGAQILVNLLALKFQDLKKKSLRLLHPQ